MLLAPLAADGEALVRVQTPTPEHRQWVTDLGLDVWTEVPTGPWLDVRLRAGERALLDQTGLDYAVRVPDLGARVREERLRLDGPVVHGGPAPTDFFADYAPLDAIDDHLASLVPLRPDLVTALEPGQSLEGHPLQALQITAAPAEAPAVLLDSGQHAREWIAIASTVCVADRLVREADTPRVAAVLDEVRIVVLPIVNPDGYAHTWDGDRFWRKNRRPPDGVDLNRNFPVAFGGPGASNNPEAGNFHGDAPFSEPEALAVRDLAESLDPLLALIDVHAYGQLVLYPWGFQPDPAPADAVLEPAAQSLRDGLAAPWNTDYVAIPGAELYPAAGNIMDWAYGELGVYAYGLEMRPGPDAEHPDGFILPPEDIIPVCDELFEGVLAVAEHITGTQPPGAGDDGAASGAEEGSGGDTTSGDTTTGLATSSTGSLPDEGTAAAGSSTNAGQPDTSSEDSGDSTGPSADTTGSGGCGCSSNTPPNWSVLLLLFAVGIRRRSRPR